MPRPYPIASGIYAIRHVASGKLYIGSAVNIFSRFNVHRACLNRGKHHSPHLQRAWDKYGSDAFAFEVLQLVEGDAELIRVEQEYLDRFRVCDSAFGYNTCSTAGTCRGRRDSDETRERKSASRKGIVYSAETRAKMSESARNRSPEARVNMAAAQKGKKHSPEHCAKIAEGVSRYVRSPEGRAQRAAASTGRTLSPEARERIAASKRGVPRSPETIAKISAALKRRAASK